MDIYINGELVNISHVASYVVWLANAIYALGILPQVYLNYKLKSTKGLSDFTIYTYMVGYISYLFYVYCLNLHISYKVLVPVAFGAIMYIVFQRFYYGDGDTDNIPFIFYAFSWILSVMLIPLAARQPSYIGNASGWVANVLFGVCMLPQMIKIYLNKSTKGFSFYFATILSLGVLVEFVASIVLKLPLQTTLGAVRGFLGYLVFFVQFMLYRSK